MSNQNDEEFANKVVNALASTPGVEFSREDLSDLKQIIIIARGFKAILVVVHRLVKGLIYTGWLWLALYAIATGHLEQLKRVITSGTF